MVEALDRANWNHTFALIAGVYNSQCSDKADLIDLMQYFPWNQTTREAAPPSTPEEEEMLAEIFPGSRKN